MTEQKQAKAINLIPKPIQRAFYAGTSAGGFSFVFGVPAEYLLRVAVIGACYSLVISWQELGKKPRMRRGRQVVLNGNRTIDLEYSLSEGGYITRETWGEKVNRWVYGKSEAVNSVKPKKPVPRPTELDEFTFLSKGIQLREGHVKLFLKSAWRNRQYGKGLSERHWVREFSQRPAWYKELSPSWFYAMRQLLFNAQNSLRLQIVVIEDNQWMSLACDPHTTMRLLRWYESEKNNAKS